MTDTTNLEAFNIQFSKLVAVLDVVRVDKQIDIDVAVQGNSALADAKGEAVALGPNSHAETLGLTSTTAVDHFGSSSSSIAESLSATSHFPM
jgi:hypothetical protein